MPRSLSLSLSLSFCPSECLSGTFALSLRGDHAAPSRINFPFDFDSGVHLDAFLNSVKNSLLVQELELPPGDLPWPASQPSNHAVVFLATSPCTVSHLVNIQITLITADSKGLGSPVPKTRNRGRKANIYLLFIPYTLTPQSSRRVFLSPP